MDHTVIKVGDVVCDCRYLHLPVVALIDPVYGYESQEETDRADALEARGESYPEPAKLIDITAVFEDGFQCSVVHCCDSVPHEWLHDQ